MILCTTTLQNRLHNEQRSLDIPCSCPCRASLEELNISWCRGVPEPWMGVLADSCTKLRKLTVFGCSQVCTASAVLLYQEQLDMHRHISKVFKDYFGIRPEDSPR